MAVDTSSRRSLGPSRGVPALAMAARGRAQSLGALAAQFLHACSDRREVVGGARSDALAAQLLHACPDRRKIVSGARSGHVSSVSWRTAGTTF
jgi:hypothetical protein